MRLNDLAHQQSFRQQYSSPVAIVGVKILETVIHNQDQGDFSEVFRVSSYGRLLAFPKFKLKQINRTRLEPGNIKAWHLHRQQDEIWYVSPTQQLTIGLWDLRATSKTTGQQMRMVLGAGNMTTILIPKGVAHGSVNLSANSVDLWVFVNQHFKPNKPDEYRLHWDAAGAEFWDPERD